VQLLVFAGVMLLAAVADVAAGQGEQRRTGRMVATPERSMLKIGAEGLGVGVVTGFVGVGGGFLIVPALVLLGG
jgi:uncharacterized membrane protein YfcA